MDFNLKQWRDDSDDQDNQTAPKLPGLDLLNPAHHHHHQPPASSSALPLFVPESATPATAPAPAPAPAATKFPFSGMGGSYFSLSQWQELELQALIFRHMTTGDPIPPELLHHVKKSLVASPNYSHYFAQHYFHHYHSPLVQQSGYWGRAAMDPEPGRCRRTDGKKWRCSRDVVAGQKYCERHMHRGRNRSRKPVEVHASTASPYGSAAPKSGHSIAPASAAGDTSIDLLQFNHRATGIPFEAQKEGGQPSNRMLRHFFNDWPKTVNEAETDLSISMPGNLSSDFSLKLGYSNVDDEGNKQQPQVNWGMGWESINPGPAMGGPLAEALRSSTTTSSSLSPTSVLHSMPRRGGQASDSS